MQITTLNIHKKKEQLKKRARRKKKKMGKHFLGKLRKKDSDWIHSELLEIPVLTATDKIIFVCTRMMH